MANDAFMSALEVFEKSMDIKPVSIDMDDSIKDSFSVELSFENDKLSFEDNTSVKEEIKEPEVKESFKLSEDEVRKVQEWLDYIERTSCSKKVRKMCKDVRSAVHNKTISYEALYTNLETIKREYNSTIK